MTAIELTEGFAKAHAPMAARLAGIASSLFLPRPMRIGALIIAAPVLYDQFAELAERSLEQAETVVAR